jgi:hypothetical protein
MKKPTRKEEIIWTVILTACYSTLAVVWNLFLFKLGASVLALSVMTTVITLLFISGVWLNITSDRHNYEMWVKNQEDNRKRAEEKAKQPYEVCV